MVSVAHEVKVYFHSILCLFTILAQIYYSDDIQKNSAYHKFTLLCYPLHLITILKHQFKTKSGLKTSNEQDISLASKFISPQRE